MKELCDAISTLFNADEGEGGAYDAIDGELHFGIVPPKTGYPSADYNFVSLLPDDTFTEEGKDDLLRFNIYSESGNGEEAADIYQKFYNLFHDCTLSISGYSFISMLWESGDIFPVTEEESGGFGGYQATMMFRVIYEKLKS